MVSNNINFIVWWYTLKIETYLQINQYLGLSNTAKTRTQMARIYIFRQWWQRGIGGICMVYGDEKRRATLVVVAIVALWNYESDVCACGARRYILWTEFYRAEFYRTLAIVAKILQSHCIKDTVSNDTEFFLQWIFGVRTSFFLWSKLHDLNFAP